jgi:hypothetical protein
MSALRKVSGIDRFVAVALALIWGSAGLGGLVVAYCYGRWGLVVLACFAFWYAVVWARVAARARVLTWREFLAPWRAR